MSNLPQEHHRLNTRARHRAKALTALLWVARFRWSATALIDLLLGGNGLIRKLIEQGLLIEHLVPNPFFAPVRYYVTLSKEGLALLARHWHEIGRSDHGHLAMCLSNFFALPDRPDYRIREVRFQHDLQLQYQLAHLIRRYEPRIEGLELADDLERVPLGKRPSKIPDAIVHLRAKDFPVSRKISQHWIEVEFSRKNARDIDLFCAYYRSALANITERKFTGLLIYCDPSLLAQWRKSFARTRIPKWHFRKDQRTWVQLNAEDMHHLPELSQQDVDGIIRPFTRAAEATGGPRQAKPAKQA